MFGLIKKRQEDFYEETLLKKCDHINTGIGIDFNYADNLNLDAGDRYLKYAELTDRCLATKTQMEKDIKKGLAGKYENTYAWTAGSGSGTTLTGFFLIAAGMGSGAPQLIDGVADYVAAAGGVASIGGLSAYFTNAAVADKIRNNKKQSIEFVLNKIQELHETGIERKAMILKGRKQDLLKSKHLPAILEKEPELHEYFYGCKAPEKTPVNETIEDKPVNKYQPFQL